MVLRCSPRSTRWTQGDVQGAGPAAQPKRPQVRPALGFAPSLSGFQQGLGEGRGRFWAVPWEGAGLPGLLPWGRGSNTTGWRINRQVLRLVTAVKTAQKTQLGEDGVVAGGRGAALGAGGVVVKALARGVPRGYWERRCKRIFAVPPVFPKAPSRLRFTGANLREADPGSLGGFRAPSMGLGPLPALLPS